MSFYGTALTQEAACLARGRVLHVSLSLDASVHGRPRLLNAAAAQQLRHARNHTCILFLLLVLVNGLRHLLQVCGTGCKPYTNLPVGQSSGTACAHKQRSHADSCAA